MKQKTISVSEFKAKALRLLEQVGAGEFELVITKRGRSLAEVSRPKSTGASKPAAGRLADTIVFEGDIISPLGPEMWGVLK